MEGGSRRAIVAAFSANLGIAVAKFVGFAFTGAASMLAEAVHSLADTVNQALLLFGGRRASRAPSDSHPFGYGRERFFWAFIVALVIFSVGSMFALFEGVEKLRHPHEVSSTGWAVVILSLAIVLESLSFRTALQECRAVKGPGSWWSFIRRAKIPELPVVLLEDAAALVGLAIALAGVGLARATGNSRWDAAGSVGIGLLLGVVAVVLVVEMKSLLIGESASGAQQRAITDAIEAAAPARRVIHLRTEHLGPDELLVGAKVEFDAALSFAGLAVAIDEAEARIRKAVPAARVIYLEPDVYRDESGPSSDAGSGAANR